MPKGKVIVLHSGGMDSTVCLLLAREQGHEVMSLGIDYGQKSRAELECAEKLCARLGVERRILHVEWDKPARQMPLDRGVEEMKTTVSPAFLPMRNALFLVLACAEAPGAEADQVWIGVNSLDYSGYPDCRPQFIEAFRQMVALGMNSPPQIVAPLSHLSKPDIAREASRLGLGPDDTWSCYRPVNAAHGYEPCGRCDACVLHRFAWDEFLKGSDDDRSHD